MFWKRIPQHASCVKPPFKPTCHFHQIGSYVLLLMTACVASTCCHVLFIRWSTVCVISQLPIWH